MSVDVEIENVVVKVGESVLLDDVSLVCERGTFVTLLGPSGSGKTTTLNVVSGFMRQASGHVRVGGQNVDYVEPQRRGLGIVFQNYALFPHMSVGENVQFPLLTRKVRGADRARRCAEALELVGLGGMEARPVASLSGGQQQRVAIARALVFEPNVLLLDEPLAALDKQLREVMQGELKRIQREVGVTTIAVTHDQTEALSMSDKVAVLRDGRVEQIGTPRALYEQPETQFVAEFVGEKNLLPVDANGELTGFGIPVSQGKGQALLRPEDIGVMEFGDQGLGNCKVRVGHVAFLGSRLHVTGVPMSPEAVSVSFYVDKELWGESLGIGRELTLVSKKKDPRVFMTIH